MRMFLTAFGLFGIVVGTSVAQDIPPVTDLQIIPTWEHSSLCPDANAELQAGKTVHLRYQDEKKKKVELELPADRIHKDATQTVRNAMFSQARWTWNPPCLFVVHPPLESVVPLPLGLSFLRTALAEENGLRALRTQKQTGPTSDTGLDAAIAECKRLFPADFVTQEHCIKRQTEAYRRLRGGRQS